MDRLSDLPPKPDTVMMPHESEVMQQFFGKESTQGQAPPNEEQTLEGASIRGKINWKLIGFSAVLFVLLANPWIDKALCKIPYCGENAASLLGLKALIFVVVLVILCLFV